MSYPSDPELGWYYVVNVAGEVEGVQYEVGDWIVWNGASWDRVAGVRIVNLNQIVTREHVDLQGVLIDQHHSKVHGNEVHEFTVLSNVLIRPNADGAVVDWNHSGVGNHYEDVDDVVEQPDAGDADYISTNVDNQIEEFGLQNMYGLVCNYTVWLRVGVSGSSHTKNLAVFVDYNDGNGWTSIGNVIVDADAGIVYELIVVNGVNRGGIGWKIKLQTPLLSSAVMSVYVLYLDVEW